MTQLCLASNYVENQSTKTFLQKLRNTHHIFNQMNLYDVFNYKLNKIFLPISTFEIKGDFIQQKPNQMNTNVSLLNQRRE
jgi:hypothetical protein